VIGIILEVGVKGYNKSRHCVYSLRYHIIFVTKYRYGVIEDSIREELYSIMQDTAIKLKSTILEINGESDHVHFILETPPDASSIALIVNILKSVTSRLLRKKYPALLHRYYGTHSRLWSRSYFAASVGTVSLATLVKYIKNQDRPDSSPTCRG